METKNKYFPPQTEILEMNFEGVMCLSSSDPMDSGEGWGESRSWEEL
jgi:hypothetical protein